MSLKAFHIFFLIVSILLLFGFGFWGILDYRHSSNPVHLILGVVSLPCCILLGWYARTFLRRFKGWSYL